MQSSFTILALNALSKRYAEDRAKRLISTLLSVDVSFYKIVVNRVPTEILASFSRLSNDPIDYDSRTYYYSEFIAPWEKHQEAKSKLLAMKEIAENIVRRRVSNDALST